MTGLKLIRQRCNYTIGSFAKQLGVSRQIVSEWELGNKEIPPQRKAEISELLGISADFLGCINEEQKNILINKAMFTCNDTGIRTYTYKPPISSDDKPMPFMAHFFSEDFEPEIEELARLEKERKSLIKQIDFASPYRDCHSTTDKILTLNSDLLLYQRFFDCYNEIRSDHIDTKYRLGYWNIFLTLLDSVANTYRNEPNPISTVSTTPNYDNPFDSYFKQLLETFTNTINEALKETKSITDAMSSSSAHNAPHPNSNDKTPDSEWRRNFHNLSHADQIKCVEDDWLKQDVSTSNQHQLYYVPLPRNPKLPYNND